MVDYLGLIHVFKYFRFEITYGFSCADVEVERTKKIIKASTLKFTQVILAVK